MDDLTINTFLPCHPPRIASLVVVRTVFGSRSSCRDRAEVDDIIPSTEGSKYASVACSKSIACAQHTQHEDRLRSRPHVVHPSIVVDDAVAGIGNNRAAEDHWKLLQAPAGRHGNSW